MKPDLARYLSDFLGEYLPVIKGVSPHTISSYSDTFRLFLGYCQDKTKIRPEKMYISDITCVLITDFLKWIEFERGCSVSTCNQRQAAICSFLHYVQIYTPSCIGEFQKILSLPIKKKITAEVSYISFEAMKCILDQPDRSKKDGRRDQAMLCLLYDTGARVSELTSLRVHDIRLIEPARVTLYGKGRKQRNVPLMDDTKRCLKQYMAEHQLMEKEHQMLPLFQNHQGKEFTRAGINYILHKYVEMARQQKEGIPKQVSPHILRHSKAMHLLQAGVNIVYIKDILGHADITTTQVYLKADMEMKKAALEKVKIEIQTGPEVPSWATDTDLIQWLTELGQKTRT